MAKRKKSKAFNALSKALQNHAKDETNYGMEIIPLPSGIRGGIAKLTDAKIGIYKSGRNEGKQFVYLGGRVVSPREVNVTKKVFAEGKVQVSAPETVKIEGQLTNQLFPICETTKGNGDVVELDTNIERMLNELRKLGGEECTADLESDKDLESLLKDLVGAEIFFKFNTSSRTPTVQYPEEQVWENWNGAKGLEDYEPEEDDGIEEDESADVEKGSDDDSDDSEDSEEDSFDAMALAKEADENDDDEAAIELGEAAEAAGIDPDEFESWADVAKALLESSEDDSEDSDDGDLDEDEEDTPPEKGEVYNFKPPKSQKLVPCEVTAVFAGKETCNLKRLDTGKSHKGIPWEKLTD